MHGRRLRAMSGVVAACGLLSGCWLQVGYDGGQTRWNGLESTLTTANVDTLAPRWTYTAPGATLSEPIVFGSQAFVRRSEADTSVSVVALESANGAATWERVLTEPGDTPMFAPQVTIVGGHLWASWLGLPASGVGCGRQVRLDRADGTVVGEDPGAAGLSVPRESAGHVVQMSSFCYEFLDADLTVRDTGTLATEWTAPAGDRRYPVGSGVALSADHVYVAAGGAVDVYPLAGCGAAQCAPAWTVDLHRTVTAGPVVTPDGQLVVTLAPTLPGGTDDEILSLSAATGAVTWRAPLGGTGAGLAVTGDHLYVTPAGTGPAVGTLVVFAAEGCGAAACAPVWNAPVGVSAGVPTVAGDVVYVPADGGTVHAFAAAGCGAGTCAPLASVAVDGEVTALSVAHGQLLVSSDTGTEGVVTAFAPT